MPAIVLDNIHKSYGSHIALRGLSFSVDEGEVVGFLGPNGAGKSTAMKILTGFLAPTNGHAHVHGVNVLAHPIEAQKHIGYLPENAPIYPDMQVGEYLNYVGQIRRLGTAERSRAIVKVSEQCAITDRLRQSVGALSKGYRQRLGLAQALLHDPSVLVLDEPTTGLDPNQIAEIRNLIRRIGQKTTIILSTHILSEVQATCDRVVIINNGEKVADGTTADVITRTQGGLLVYVEYAPGTVSPNQSDLTDWITQVPGVDRVTAQDNPNSATHRFELLTRTDVRPLLFELAIKRGIVLLELTRERTDLEEIFRRLTHHQTSPESPLNGSDS